MLPRIFLRNGEKLGICYALRHFLRSLFVTVLLIFSSFYCCAQTSNPLIFSLSISPSLSGNTDGRVLIGINWNDWLKTSFYYISENTSDDYLNSNVESSLNTNKNILDVEIFAIDQDLLWKPLIKKNEVLVFGFGLFCRFAWIDSREIGYIIGSSNSFYFEKRTITYFRPLVSLNFGFHFQPIDFDFSCLVTPLSTFDTTYGEFATSTNPVFNTFYNSGLGFDYQYNFSVRTNTKLISPLLSGTYSVHKGVTQTNKTGIEDVYALELREYKINLDFLFSFARQRYSKPIFGLSWSLMDNYVYLRPALSSILSKYSFNFGYAFGY